MSDHERGAYTPPTDAPLSFDARQPVRGSRPLPFTLIISILVLAGLAAAMFIFYRSGVRHAGEPPQAVGVPVGGMKAAPPAEAQPQDPAAGLQIYKTEGGKASGDGAISPQFTAPPEQPQTRPQAAAPTVVVTPAAPAAPAPALRPSIPAQPPAASVPAAPPKPEAPSKPPPPATKAEAPAPKSAPPVAKAAAPVSAKPAPAKPEAKAAAPAPAAKPAAGVAAVQIGAFSSQALADKGWSDAASVSPGAAAGKGKFVEKVDKDGKTLFRTQVTGFASRADAVAFCDKLKAAGKACFVK
ncbi:SPOR domain-containing protein [Phenylobacterium sp.]|uniref:SPOR domain-containing protein n=1 Tax=Phenylobacterium sp. TaxID=1871053 RepID=UPI001222F372|nr:SPOR domain-containing protein [Phenylobacterium sp.]THD52244.1 MAG: SPOR domain-containing protein [Phenylobacterium sp.]